MSYAIRFDLPGCPPEYAGDYKGALGFAPTLASARLWDDPEVAARFLVNGYGAAMREFGRVIEVKA